MQIHRAVHRVFQFYLAHYLHFALCVIAFVWFQYQSFNVSVNQVYLWFLFFGVLTIYNLHKIRWKKFTNKRQFYLEPYFLIFAIGFFGTLILSIFLPSTSWILLIPSSIISLGYVLPIFKENKKLRDFKFLKIILISVVIGWVCVFIPLFERQVHLHILMLTTLSKVFFTAALCLAFDIGDMLIDDSKIKTIPNLIGKRFSKFIAYLFIFIALLIDVYLTNLFLIDFLAFLSISIVYLISSILILISNEKKDKSFYLFWIDGMFGLFAIVYIGLNMIN